MASYNKVIIQGNLTRDPETGYTTNGTAVTNFDIAVNRKYHANGEAKEEVVFVPVTFFGKQAEAIQEHVKKGHCLLVEGRLKIEIWEDRDTGKNRSKMIVLGELASFQDNKKDDNSSGQSPQSRQSGAQERKTDPAPIEDNSDDIPF